MSDKCVFCGIADGSIDSKKIYEDDKVIAALHPFPATHGHMILFPKKHFTILEQLPDADVAYIFQIANKLSIAAFDTMNCGGTNIVVMNGIAAGQSVPHAVLNIIPRNENDGLNMQWQPKQLNEEEMSTVELILKEEAANIGEFQKEEKKAEEVKKKIEQLPSDDENYLIRQLRRIPGWRR